MGLTQKLGTIPLAILTDSSNNVGIGAAANASFKLQVTGATNLTGALSGTSATFSGNLGVGTASPSVYTNLNTITINGTNGSVIDFKTGEVLYGELYSLANELRVDAVGASGVLKLMTNSVSRLTIASTGAATFSSSVGVGGAPSGTYGTLSVFGGISTKDDNNGKLEIGRYSSGAPNSYIKIGTNSGSLRITNAADTIDLVSFFNSGFTFFGTIPSVTNYIKYNFNVGTNQNIGFRSSSSIARLEATNDAVNANVPMEFAASTFIFTGGNVGIGTSSPSSLLHLQSSASGGQNLRIQTSIAAGRNYVQFANGSGDMGYFGYGGANGNFFIVNQLNADMLFYTNDTERMRITSGGVVNVLNDLGVGTATPSGKIHGVGINASSSNNVIYLENAVATVLFRIRNDGAFFTGTGSSSPYNNTSGGSANLIVTSAGSLERSTSSLKYKTDVRNYDKGIAEVMQMRPVYYKGKGENDGDKQYAGLIAEEIHELGLTEFVQYAEDGSPDALAYQNMIALLVKGMQELKAEIEILKNK